MDCVDLIGHLEYENKASFDQLLAIKDKETIIDTNASGIDPRYQ